MRSFKLSLAVLVLLTSALCLAEPRKSPATIHLIQPWSKLTDLTDAQKQKLSDIHRKSREEIKSIEDRAKADMNAVLTPEQQAELREMQETEAADRKLKASGKDHTDAATLPASKDE